ncbi:MAG TPA: TolC family protein [Arenimonas sp.]|nr:TolC family protein [Arenimonas sp.]
MLPLPYRRALRGRLLCAILLTAASHAAAAELGFEQALQLALQASPPLRADHHRYLSARESESAAGRLPDPELLLGIDNLPLQGEDRFDLNADPMAMRRVGLMQRFPNGGKRDAERSGAAALVAQRDAALQTSARQLLQVTAGLWIALHRVDAQLSRLDALRAELRVGEQSTLAQLAGGNSGADAVLVIRQQAALIDQRADELVAEKQQLRSQLRRHLGEAASYELAGEPPPLEPDTDALRAGLEEHPRLRAAQAARDQTGAEVAMARAEQRPDWALELGYADRSTRFGDMAMLQLRVDLPLFQRKRQQPRLAGKLGELAAADASIEATRRELESELEGLLAEHNRARRAEQRLHEVLLPLATQRVALQLADWQSGRGRLDGLLAARRDRIELELETLARRSERQTLAARLHFGFATLPSLEGLTP